MKKYKLNYTNVLEHKNDSFEITATCIKDAVVCFAKTFENSFNLANIDFYSIEADGKDLDLDGLLEAEIALRKYYI